ncbi:hypothetical protein pclt_cds_1169 [Pandoravirus celtis]|uniref:Uncharacterized protein n=1 Tax=Pandoravirus celtis TaxID=2568002 RepID=A0A4D6EIV0_9VIRU|nr:hypothetical protein pclt_cds_1169 [Pandoravirus celtis]
MDAPVNSTQSRADAPAGAYSTATGDATDASTWPPAPVPWLALAAAAVYHRCNQTLLWLCADGNRPSQPISRADARFVFPGPRGDAPLPGLPRLNITASRASRWLWRFTRLDQGVCVKNLEYVEAVGQDAVRAAAERISRVSGIDIVGLLPQPTASASGAAAGTDETIHGGATDEAQTHDLKRTISATADCRSRQDECKRSPLYAALCLHDTTAATALLDATIDKAVSSVVAQAADEALAEGNVRVVMWLHRRHKDIVDGVLAEARATRTPMLVPVRAEV